MLWILSVGRGMPRPYMNIIFITPHNVRFYAERKFGLQCGMIV